MSRFNRIVLATVLGTSLTTAAVADDGIRLSRLAGAAGYTYAWAPSEGGVTLQRPGVVIVLHAGYPMYEVNAVPVQADRAPVFSGGELLVSPAVAQRLRRIALEHPTLHSAAAAVRDSAAATTGALTINARQLPGRDALALSGTGPPNSPITIALTGELSTDLPYVLLNRTTVICGADGSFSAVAAIGQDAHRQTTIAATATSLDGAGSATARIIVNVPSPNVNSIFDQFPPK